MPEEICACRCERPATLGLLCTEHGQRLADHYGAREGHGAPGRISHGLPWMWDHVQLAYPSLAGWSGGSRDSGDIDDAEAEKLSAVIVVRSEICDHLTAVVADLAERLGRNGPPTAPTQRLAVYRAAGWLLAHIEPLRAGQGIGDAADEAVATLVEEADGLASRVHSLAPWRAAPTRIDGIPCRCGAVGTVHDHGDVRRCWRCAKTYTETEWAALMRVLAHRFSEEGQTA
jgi:hypothetical protein